MRILSALSITVAVVVAIVILTFRVKGNQFSKYKIKWVSGMVFMLLMSSVFIVLTNRSEREMEEPLISDVEVAKDSEIERFNEQLDILVNQVILGSFKASILQDYGDAYQFIVDTKFDGIALLKEKLEAVRGLSESNHTALIEKVREKQCLEWLISDIIRNQVDDEENIREAHAFTIIRSDMGYGRMSPDLEGDVWVEIPKNTVIQITGFYNLEWMLAKLIMPTNSISVEASEAFMNSDQVEFWIAVDDYVNETTLYNDMFDNKKIALPYVGYFDYIVNSSLEEKKAEYIPIHVLPTSESAAVGYVSENDLIAVKRDDHNEEIRQADWVLVGQFDEGDDTSTIGWIKTSFIGPLTKASKPNQGFILRGTKAYEYREGTSGPEFKVSYDALLRYTGIQLVHILDRQEGWVHFVDSDNVVSGWIRETDMIYQMTDEVERVLYHPKCDLDLFAKTLRSEILSNNEFKISAKDVNKALELTVEEKNMLANSLSKISSATKWEGGISGDREAAYPYYILDFGDYSMVITSDDQLLLLMASEWRYAYGVGSEGAVVTSVEPNGAFLEMIKTLFPVDFELSNSTDINYLFKADRVRIYAGNGDLCAESEEQVHINKCLRAVRAAMGDEIVIDDPELDITDRYEFEFIFDNDTGANPTKDLNKIVHTNRYVFWNGIYYKALETPQDIQMKLFSGYF